MEYTKSKNNWCSELKEIFSVLNMNDVYTNKGTCDIKHCTQKLYDLCMSEWNAKVLNSPKLRTYKIFKVNIGLEDYIKLNLERGDRSLFSQLRLGILPLRVESGHLIGEKLENRICINCQRECIEDEKHFVFECSLYEDLRKTLFDNVKEGEPNFDDLDIENKWYILMHKCVRKTATFVKRAYVKRKIEMNMM